MKKQLLLIASALSLMTASHFAQAQQLTVSIKNLTHGIYFTPLLVGAHSNNAHLFQSGTTASAALQAMAEGGDISQLVAQLNSVGANIAENPANGLLAPSESTITSVIDTDSTGNNYLSVVAMMLPTNDGFIGLDAWPIPTTAGTYTVNLNAYDAGTEANNELINSQTGGMPGVLGIPADPGSHAGSGGTGVSLSDANTHVHIHRGTLGDTDVNGGLSDLDSRVHRWLNPVARITVTVQ